MLALSNAAQVGLFTLGGVILTGGGLKELDARTGEPVAAFGQNGVVNMGPGLDPEVRPIGAFPDGDGIPRGVHRDSRREAVRARGGQLLHSAQRAIGGAGPALIPQSLTQAYDPTSNTWTLVATMPTSREGLAAAVANGNVYAVGGTRNGGIISVTPLRR